MKRSDSLSPAPLGEGRREREVGGSKKINEPSMFCVVYCFVWRFARARVSLNKRLFEPSWLSLGGPQSRTCGRQFDVHFGRALNCGRSPKRSRPRGQGPVFPANERGTRHSHLSEESDVFCPLIVWRPPKSPSPACWDSAVKRSDSLHPNGGVQW